MNIPKRFIRIWVGKKPMPKIFQKWWNDFKLIHPDYEFVTITSLKDFPISEEIKRIIPNVGTCAGLSDIYRLLALYYMGGIYIDTDVMPLKSFNKLINSNQAFLGKRSGRSFETAIIGCPQYCTAIKDVIDALPEWYSKNINKTASVQTGPAFVSSVLFGRSDVTHLPSKTFYPYNGFMAPKRLEKEIMFRDKKNFPPEMLAAHFSNHRWGGKPF